MQRLISGVVGAVLLMAPGAGAQSKVKLRAEVVNAGQNAKDKAVSVRAYVQGAGLMDPTRGRNSWAAHLHYVLDDQPPVASASGRMSFHGLTSGTHAVKVQLVSDKEEVLAETRLEVIIP